MASVSQEQAIHEIATRYDLDKDGKLSYAELVAYLIAMLGANWSLPNRPQNNTKVLTGACSPESIYEIEERGNKQRRGSALIDNITKWTIATAAAPDSAEKAHLARALSDHGYVQSPTGYTRSADAPHIAEGTFDALISHRLRSGPPNKTKDQMTGLTMDITNAMISLKITPSVALQEQLGETKRWAHLKSVWAENAAASKIVIFDAASKTFAPAAIPLLKEFFAQVDADHDGSLSRGELNAWFLHVCARQYPSNFDQQLKAGAITFEQMEAFYSKEPGALCDLQLFFHHNGVDHSLKAPAKWPVLTQEGYYLDQLASTDEQKRHMAMASLKQALSQHPPVVPSKAVLDALAANPTGAPLLLACKYVEAVYGGAAVPPISSAAEAVRVMHAALTYMGWQAVPSTVNREEEPESKVIALADQHIEAFVKAHPGQLEAELEKLLPADGLGSIPEPIPALLRSGGITQPSPDVFPECLWRTLRAVKPTWLAHFVLNAYKNKSGAPSSYPHKLLAGACELGGSETAAAVATRVPPYMRDWLKSAASNTPLADVLGSDAAICDMSDVEVQTLLSTYLELGMPELAKHFAAHGITRGSMDLVGTIIVNDCKQITKVLKVPGGRHALAAKLNALVNLGHYYESGKMLSMAEARDPKGAPISAKVQANRHKMQEIQDNRAAEIKRELHVDPTNESAMRAFPIRVLRLATMGHHPDVFHPAVGMQSYYLKGDNVRGSAECMLVNTLLLKPEEADHFTLAEMEKKLTARLNASKPADWEAHPAVLYFSDMAPYLIRTACCFESPGVRYRVDPSKLWNIMMPLFETKP